MALVLMLTTTIYAQKDVTTFMGIPVDGTKEEMIYQLRHKGFTPIEYGSDILKGEFNGRPVTLFVHTVQNKVWRIAVIYLSARESSVLRTHFNNLCYQFHDNPKYMSSGDSVPYLIPADEDITYEILVHDKQYQASFTQKNNYEPIPVTTTKEEYQDSLQIEFDRSMRNLENLLYGYKNVWFTINRVNGEYNIVLFYENGHNKASGSDL